MYSEREKKISEPSQIFLRSERPLASSASLAALQAPSHFNQLIKKQLLYQNQLVDDLKNLQVKLGGIRTKGNKVNSQEEQSQSSESLLKRLQKMQHTVQQASIKRNEIIAMNSRLKEDISECRSERGIFSVVFKNLEKQLQSKKLELLRLTAQKIILQQERLVYNPSVQTNQPKDSDRDLQQPAHQEKPSLQNLNDVPQKSELNNTKQAKWKVQSTKSGVQSVQSLNLRRLHMQLGTENIQQVIELIDSIQSSNERLYSQIKSTHDQLDSLLQTNHQLEQDIQLKKKHFQSHLANRYSSVVQEQGLQKIQTQLRKEKDSLRHLLEDMNAIAPSLDITRPYDFSKQGEISQFLAQFESRVLILTSFSQQGQINDILQRMQNTNEEERVLTRQFFEESSKQEFIKQQGVRKAKKKGRK